MKQPLRITLQLTGFCLAFLPALVSADVARLIDVAVLVETNPSSDPEPVEAGDNVTITPQVTVGTATNASYVTSGGWAVTSAAYIDVATMVFDFEDATSVSAATLKLPIQTLYEQNGSVPLKLEFFSDDGVIEYTDYSIGFPSQIAEIDAYGLSQVEFDVTGAVNAALRTGQYVGFRVLSAVVPSAVTVTFPAFTGVKFFNDQYQLEFTPGPAPVSDSTIGSFDGYRLEVPKIDIPTVGEVYAQFELVDVNNQVFQLSAVEVTGATVAAAPLSGIDLFDCSAFTPPAGAALESTGISTFSINSGVLDIPDSSFAGDQYSVRLEYIEGTEPRQFELLQFGEIVAGPSDATVSDLAGGLNVEPTQDFIPACHGWILVGDSVRNRFVERNIISGETGSIYPFNTSPDEMTLDEENGLVYFTVHPRSQRLYKLDLITGNVSWNSVSQTLVSPISGFPHTYAWSLYDIAIGENGNVFALMLDNVLFNPGESIPFTTTGKWLGLMDPDANFLTDSIPLEQPTRIEYDPVLNHVFIATASNLATFDYSFATHVLDFIPSTDLPVGSGCTDFSISPDGQRLAYSCPGGNEGALSEAESNIWDMAPDEYYNIDGEWYLEDSPVSATFNNAGTVLLASDNTKLYLFDVVTHLLLEDYELGLLPEETVKKIRYSKDGGLIILFISNEVHTETSKFLYMPTPPISGTPLP